MAPKKKKQKYHKKHLHLAAAIIFITVVLASVLAFYLFQKRNVLKSPGFDDYKASKNFSGKIETVNYSSNNRIAGFKDRIEEYIKNGVNFAGHYVLAIWGCGQNCQTGAVVDAFNGNIYDLPVQSACELNFRKDSNLLIIKSGEDCSKEKTRYFIFEE